MLNRRSILRASLLCSPLAARAVTSVYPLALPEGVNLVQVRPVLDLIARHAQIVWDYQPVPVTRMLAMVENGWTLGLGPGRSSMRASRLLFSEEVLVSGLWPIARSEVRRELRSAEDLKDLRVCLVRGLDYGDTLGDARLSGFSAEYISGDFRTRVRQLMAGRCDVLLASDFNTDAVELQRRVVESGGSLDKLRVGGGSLGHQVERFATARTGPFAALIPVLDQVMKGSRKEIARLLGEKS
ncbi:substrate-binding periplasmic protein [Roseateles chitosanitabidus]|uniref:substrate-binding periplasmic protein n=1 Tax=Roseateles chitosanitabidus TaxID=65048 RepID=UPI0008332419|nr:hypothetical protein [Roseateles chitosanitabidus]